MQIVAKFILNFVISILPIAAFAFPDMVRHGYVNCISCHISPTGGGILTQYGRELSREILSHSGIEGESKFLYGAFKPPGWANLGGDFRNLVLMRDTPQFKEGRMILMQADLESAVSYKKVLVNSTFGYRETPNSESTTNNFILRRHYINYRPNDELSFRAGKFGPSFGINTADHAIVTKRGLNWDQGSETYNFEAAWIGDRYNIFVTGILGRPEMAKLKREKGAAINTSVSFLDRFKMGLSYFNGKSETQKRQVYGLWGILGFNPHFYLLTELDFQDTIATSRSRRQTGLVNYNKIDFEFVQGIHGFTTLELQQSNLSKENALNKFVGLGIQYFPRPHLDIIFTLQRHFYAAVEEPTNFGFLVLHFYP
jgi:hypothetical protein